MNLNGKSTYEYELSVCTTNKEASLATVKEKSTNPFMGLAGRRDKSSCQHFESSNNSLIKDFLTLKRRMYCCLERLLLFCNS